jgi:dihydrofolate synthase / folylpolyglutamate synthase
VLAEALDAQFPGTRAAFVLGVLTDKDVRAFVKPLADRAERWYLAKPAGPRGRPADQLRAALMDVQPVPEAAGSVAEAIERTIASGAPLIVVAGSLATVAEARVSLGLATNDPAP